MASHAAEFRSTQVLLNQFYADCLYALAEHCRSKRATAQGAPAVLKRVATEWGIEAAEAMVLPRLTRQQLQQRQENPPYREVR